MSWYVWHNEKEFTERVREASIDEWQRQIENWNADKLKTDQFIQIVKRYTDFSELTTPMLNEFIEKVIVHEGEGRGNDRQRRRNLFISFIFYYRVYMILLLDKTEQIFLSY